MLTVIAKTLDVMKVNALPAQAFGRLQSQMQEELRPLFGRALSLSPSTASGIPSVLRPQGGAFKGEL